MVELATAVQSAESLMAEHGLRRIDSDELTIRRLSVAHGFTYETDQGRMPNRRDSKRILDLVIPPAWTEVRIAADADAHLQAVGRDEAGRLQYIYHSAWEDVRSANKTARMLQLGDALGRLRRGIAADLQKNSPHLALAAAARLVDALHIRAGHEAYAGEESGRGAATLLKKHLNIENDTISLRFRGKGGKQIEKSLTDAPLAAALVELHGMRGPRLFKLRTSDGYRSMTANDLNAYLAETAKRPITAKDFRTLYASSTALHHLGKFPRPDTLRAVRKSIAEIARLVSAELVNTPAVCRKSYILPVILTRYETEGLDISLVSRARRNLTLAETRLLDFLSQCT